VGAELEVPLPVPYSLPPKPYEQGERPWAVGVPWPGVDSLGRTSAQPFGANYGYDDDDDYFDGLD
jgi:hypothetical protein